MTNLYEEIEKLGYKVIPNGANFKMCCPFHQEQTPSCLVDESSNFFKCFGCGEWGTIEKLLKKLEIQGYYSSDLLTGKKEKLLSKIADALSAYTIFPTNAKRITTTIRGITPETFKIFNVYTTDLYPDSLIFPIYYRGVNRGFIEKVLNGKYISHFTQGYIPYNIDRIKSSYAILVEGVFDALSVYQAGFKNVFASLSASYSKSLLSWVNRLKIEHLYILYDGDDTGYTSAKKLNLTYPDSTPIYMPNGTDPNSLDNLKEFLLSRGIKK